MMGKKAIESARIFIRESGLDGLLTPEAFLEEREGMLQDLFPTCQLLPGESMIYVRGRILPLSFLDLLN